MNWKLVMIAGLSLVCTGGSGPRAEVASVDVHIETLDEFERPIGEAKNWGCSNHNPQHLATAKEISQLSTAHGCKGWKRVRP